MVGGPQCCFRRQRCGSGGVCVTTETRPFDRLGQLGEFEQDTNTGLASSVSCVWQECFGRSGAARDASPHVYRRLRLCC